MPDDTFRKLIIVEADTSGLAKLTGDVTKAQAILDKMGMGMEQATKITQASTQVTSNMGKVTTQSMYNIETASGKTFKTIIKDTGQATAQMGDFERALRRVVIVAPTWMIFRSIMMWVTQTFQMGLQDLIKFETAFIKLSQTIKGYSGTLQETLNAVRKDINKLATTTGEDESAITETFQKFNQAGMSVNQAMKVTKETINGSIASFGELKGVTDAVLKTYILYKDTLNANIPIEQQTTLLQAKLLELRKNNLIDTNSFNKSLASFLPIGKSVNLTLDQTLALLATLSNVEASAGDEGQRLKQSILQFMKNLPQVTSDLGIMAEAGQDTFKTLIMVLETIDKMSSTGQQNKWINELFGGARTSTGGRILIEMLDKLRENYKSIGTEGANAQTKINQLLGEYVSKLKEAEDAPERIQKRMKELQEDIGKSFIEGITGANNFTDAMKSMASYMKELTVVAKGLGNALRLAWEYSPLGLQEKMMKIPISRLQKQANELNKKALEDLEALKKKYNFQEPTSTPGTSSAPVGMSTYSISPDISNQLNDLQRAKELIEMGLNGYNNEQLAVINLNRYIKETVDWNNKKVDINNQIVPQLNAEVISSLALEGNYQKIEELMRLQEDDEKKLLEIGKLVNKVYDERAKIVEKYSDMLKDTLKSNIAEQLNAGTLNLTSLTTSIGTAWKKALVESSSTMLSEKITSFGGLGKTFGNIFGGVENPFASPLEKSFYKGGQILQMAIEKGCANGAGYLGGGDGGTLSGGVGGFGDLRNPFLTPAEQAKYANTGSMGKVPIKRPGGFLGLGNNAGSFWGNNSYAQVGMAGITGAMGGYQSGGGAGAIMGGIGSMLTMTPLAPLGIAMMIGSLFMGKKSSSTQSSWQAQKAPEMLPLNLFGGIAPLPETYPLPSSRYFAGQQRRGRGQSVININIDKIEGTNEEIANTIAGKVADIYNRELNRGLNNQI